jgi:glycosyl transferase family 4
MTGLRVLIVNRTLAGRTGTETYTRDLALALLRTDHTPMVYSPTLGELADELRGAAIPVASDLRALGDPPDVIHGHHLLETLAALSRFPGVPAVFVCHDASAWEATPPRHPRIHRYVAVDTGCRERLVDQEGIDASRCVLIPNAVDLGRFQPRGPLPERPRRALAFGHVLDAASVSCLERVCSDRGIVLTRAGAGIGGELVSPEASLGEHDLVFAKARCALEAMAVGAAVVVCGPGGVGTLVTSAELDALRPLNFGRRSYRLPVDAEHLGAQVDRYDARDAEAVSRRIRSLVGLDALCAAFVEVYEAVVEEQRAAPPSWQEESEALADSLVWIARHWEGTVLRAVKQRVRKRLGRRGWRRLLRASNPTD